MDFIEIYDITKDTLRTKASNRLKDYGCERIQYSAFLGSLEQDSLDSMQDDLEGILRKGSTSDSILIIPICKTCQEKIQELGEKRDILADDRLLFLA